MKVPTWAYVIGIIMIVFGGCGVVNNVQSIKMPEIISMQREIIGEKMDEVQAKKDSLREESIDTSKTTEMISREDSINREAKRKIGKMLSFSEESQKWFVRFGYFGIFISFIYILGGIFLFTIKPFSLKLAYFALGLSILFSVIKAIVLTSDSSGGFLSMISGISQIFGIIIDIILIIVILAMDKTAFNFNPEDDYFDD